MATLYSEIYELFLGDITDFTLAGLTESELEEQLRLYLKKSIPKFSLYCAKNLTDRDDVLNQFNIDLSDVEKDILASYMLLQWIQPQITNQQLLQEKLGSRDFNLFSSSQQLKELMNLRSDIENELNETLTLYLS